MKIAVITDTHDNAKVVEKAVELFTEQAVEVILHAGDITSPSTVRALGRVKGAKLLAVYGNCDCDRQALEEVITSLGGSIHAGVYEGSVDGRELLMTHDPQKFGVRLRNTAAELVVYGHTHLQDIRKDGRTLVVNPGPCQAVIIDLEKMTWETFMLR